MGPQVLWWALIAACALVLPVALRLLLSAGSTRNDHTLGRMRSIAKSATQADLVQLQAANGKRPSQPFLRDLDHMTEMLQMPVSGIGFAAITGVGALAIGALAVAALGSILSGLVAALSCVVLALAVLRARYATRVEAFVLQLPDALDLMMRGLRVGHPISATISNVGRTMPDPIGAEFRRITKKIGHGEYLTDAFSDLARKMNQEDMHYLAVSIRIQHGTGGNLADILATLSKVVRARIMLRRRVRALSSEGRISALLLSSLPVMIYGATSFLAPDYYGAVQDDPLFLPIACVIIALIVANFLILRRLVTFEA